MKRKGIPLIIFVSVIVCALIATIFISNQLSDEIVVEDPTIIEYNDTIPVISENNYLINPFMEANITIGKDYYNYKGEQEEQEKSLTLQDNTYYQNTGIDYVKEETFTVVAIADGTVTLVKEDENVGKVVEIEHKNGLMSIYQSLGEVNVTKGDVVTQGQVIGKSGTNEMDKELGNHLHFEMYENGISVNPANYLNKDYKKEN